MKILIIINIVLLIIIFILLINKINKKENENFIVCGGYCEIKEECNKDMICINNKCCL